MDRIVISGKYGGVYDATQRDVDTYYEVMASRERWSRTPPTMVNFSFSKNVSVWDLGRLIPSDAPQKDKKQESFEKHKEAEEAWKELAGQSAERRAKHALNVLRLLLPKEVDIERFRERAEKWMEEHPGRTVLDADIAREFSKETADTTKVLKGAMTLYARVLGNDVENAHRFYPQAPGETIILDEEDEETFRQVRSLLDEDEKRDDDIDIKDVPF